MTVGGWLALAVAVLAGQEAPPGRSRSELLDYYARAYGDRYEAKLDAVLWVMRSLADKHDSGAVPLIVTVLKEGASDQERAHAADALWILGDATAVPHLVEALRDRSLLVAGFAASGLGDLADASAVPPLLALFARLPDNREQTKARIADALGKLGDRSALGPLSASVATLTDPAYLQWAQPALQRLKSGARRAPPDPLAGVSGKYFLGDGLSLILNLTIDLQRYVLTSSTDTIGNPPRSFAGRVSGDRRRLQLTPDAAGDKSRSLMIVRWGARLYLVDEGDVGRFCEAVAAGVEPRRHSFGMWFLRIADEAKPVPEGSRPEACAAAAIRR